jgi:probable F420-dependent oxidoreductase
MQFGVQLPVSDFTHPDMVRDFVQAIEGAGYHFIVSGEHVLGGSYERLRPGETLQGMIDQVYRDPFVLFSFIAAVTRKLGLTMGVLVLPQRQTGVVARQAADLDFLSNGRLCLGVGLGRNWMEYEALNEDFHTRGRRIEEQVEVLRRLWCDEVVTFEGRWHHIDRLGLNPRPVQRPIPIWFGTYIQGIVENAIKRVARVADGWLIGFPLNDELRAAVESFRGYAREAGRDPASIAISGTLRATPDSNQDELLRSVNDWKALGATSLRVAPPGQGTTLQQKIDYLVALRAKLETAI